MSFKHNDHVKLLSSLSWKENSLEILKEQQSLMWDKLLAKDTEADRFVLKTELQLSHGQPLTVFQYQSRPDWKQIQDDYMTKLQSCGGERYFIVHKDGGECCWLNFDSPITYYLGWIWCVFSGWYIMIKHYQKKHMRQDFEIWVENPSFS
eukprot:UN34744